MQVLQQGVEDPHESAAAVAAINAALDGGDPPGPRPPRKRQKRLAADGEAPGEAHVRACPTAALTSLFLPCTSECLVGGLDQTTAMLMMRLR